MAENRRETKRFTRITRPALLAAAVPTFAIFSLIWLEPQFVRSLRDLVFDQYLASAPRTFAKDGPVRIIDIDDESLRRLGQWPWPRTRMATLVEKIGNAGAAAIGLDILQTEPDSLSLENILPLLPEGAEKAALEERARDPKARNDMRLAETVSKFPVVLGMALSANTKKTPILKAGFASAGDPPERFLAAFDGAIPPVAPLAEAAKGIGFLNFIPDRDLVVRRVPTLLLSSGQIVPSLAMETLRVAQNASSYTVKASNASGETAYGAETGIIAVRVGDITVATESDGSLRVRYAGSRPERWVPAWKVLVDEFQQNEFEGRIVLIGSSAAALSDIRATPLNPVAPGVEVHAEFIEHVLSGSQVRRPDWAKGLEIVIILVGGILAGLLVTRLSAVPIAGIGAGCTAVLLVGSWMAFARGDWLIDPVFPTAALLTSLASASMVAYWSTERERGRIREAFGRYVAPEIVARLASDPDRLRLGGETRELTVIFSDIRNFTKRSETLPADEVVRFLNSVHTPLTEAVMAHGGTIDKYMGDGLMAFWNAPLDDPNHARNALTAALGMVAAIPKIDAQITAEIGTGEPLRIGIGINTGLASVGNIGSTHRFDYSIIGDTVNAAARLEPLSKTFGTAIVASESVILAAPEFAAVPLDRVTLRGRTQETAIFAVLGDANMAKSAEFRSFRAHHDEAFAAMVKGDLRAFDAAITVLERHPEAAELAQTYALWKARIEQLRLSGKEPHLAAAADGY